MDSIGQSLVNDILGGKLDNHLDTIIDSARTRKQAKAKLQAANLRVGDTVRVKGIRPQYMVGVTGTIDSKDGKKLRIKLDDASLSRLKAKDTLRYLNPDETVIVPGICVDLVDLAIEP